MRTLLTDIACIYTPSVEQPYQVESPPGDAILIEEGRITAIGVAADLDDGTDLRRVSAAGGMVTPGFVDAHQHPLYGASRHEEFELRNRGGSYEEIAAAGGGIRSSVRSLRAASDDELKAGLRRRWRQCLEHGTTTLEGKSGYGLNLEQELRMLRLLRDVARELNLICITTLLAAHEVPDEYRDRREDYISLIIEEILPAAATERLASCTDIFCERGVFSVDESRRILTASLELGLPVRLHADQLSASGGARLAAELGALSADHLEEIDAVGITALIEAAVIAVMLPGSTWFLGMDNYAPARAIIDAGGVIALATNLNPGSSLFVSQPLMMHMACLKQGLSATEAFWAATQGGARVLQLADRKGALRTGYPADLLVWELEELGEIPYQPNVRPAQVWLGGEPVVGVTLK